jgi:hypothetical protein
MVALILSLLVSLFLFANFGFYITKRLKIKSNFAEKFLIGLVACNTLVSIVSIFSPINIFIAFFFFVVGFILLFLNISDFHYFFKKLKEKRFIIFISLLFLIVGFFLALGPHESYDTDLYHLQTIKWIERYPVVPGLANLHGRIGYNSNVFTLFAFTSLQGIFDQEIYSINFSIFFIVVCYFINLLFTLYLKDGITNVFFLILFVFLIILRLKNLSSPSPDFLSSVITLFIFSRLIEISTRYEKFNFEIFIPVIILSVYLLTVKLSALPILLISFFILLKFKVKYKDIYWLSFLILVIIMPWIVRNIILTGWLVYPQTVVDIFNFDWKVPLASVVKEKIAITGWARIRGDYHTVAAAMDFREWFPIWWQSQIFLHRLIILLSFIFPIIITALNITRVIKISYLTYSIVITSLAGVIFWLLLAPTWRFGESYLLIASMTPLLVLKKDLLKSNYITKILILVLVFTFGYYTLHKNFVVLFLFVGFLYINYHYNLFNNIKINFIFIMLLFFSTYIKRNFAFVASNSSNLILPKKNPIPSILKFKTYEMSGVTIYVPLEGDRCYDIDFPCTPYPDSTLVLRGNTLRHGFKHVNESRVK